MVQKSGDHQLIWRICHYLQDEHRMNYTSQVVVWDFFHEQYDWKTRAPFSGQIRPKNPQGSQVTGGLEIPEPCYTESNPSFLEGPMIL